MKANKRCIIHLSTPGRKSIGYAIVMLLLFAPKRQMKARIFGGSAFAVYKNKGNQEQAAKETHTTASEALGAVSCMCTKLFGPSMPNPQSRIRPSSIFIEP